MDLGKRIKCLVQTGKLISEVLDSSAKLNPIQQNLFELVSLVKHHNPWYSEWSVMNSLRGIVHLLNEDDLIEWTSNYYEKLKNKSSVHSVGIVMAGNIPLVGFHDLICVFIVGDKAKIKMSSDDAILLPIIIQLMKSVDVTVDQYIELSEQKLSNIDKVIATGSNNSSRYFDYYFGKYPNIIRKSRTSLAVLTGDESEMELQNFAKDLFFYYGLGCRNVSKIFLPENYNVPKLMDVLQEYAPLMENNKYINNLEYHKSILLINSVSFLDGGFFLMKPDVALYSPVSVIHYQFYKDKFEVHQFIQENANQLQCVVSKSLEFSSIALGEAQFPKLWDYADKVDTLEFLLS